MQRRDFRNPELDPVVVVGALDSRSCFLCHQLLSWECCIAPSGSGSINGVRNRRAGKERTLALVAGFASGGSFLLPMAGNTTGHGGDVCGPAHHFHLRHIAMAHLAAKAGFEVRTMTPIDKTGNGIDRLPGNRLSRLGECSQLLNRRLVSRYSSVAAHAGLCNRQRHQVARLRVGMTELAGKLKAQMCLMAERERLHRRAGGSSFRVGCRALLRRGRRQKQCWCNHEHALHHPQSQSNFLPWVHFMEFSLMASIR